MATSLARSDIIGALRELISELRSAGEVAGIRIVGGAALALLYFDRGTTQDLDSLHIQPGSDEAVAAAATRVAVQHGWDPLWLNFAVEPMRSRLSAAVQSSGRQFSTPTAS